MNQGISKRAKLYFRPSANRIATTLAYPNKMLVRGRASDPGVTGRPPSLSCPVSAWAVSVCLQWDDGNWDLAVRGQSFFLRCDTPRDARFSASHVPHCQFISTICPCSSLASASLVKTSQDGNPRRSCMTAMAEGMLGDMESCCAVVAIIQTGPGWCPIACPPQHLLSCETALYQHVALSCWRFLVGFGWAQKCMNPETAEV